MNSADLEQGTQEWLQARVGNVTASRISAVMAAPKKRGESEAVTRRNYKAQLVCERLTGRSAEIEFENWHTRRGTELEPEARIEYELREDSGDLRTVGFVKHPTIPYFGCSPDALVGDRGLAQFKCPIPAVHLDYLKARTLKVVPADYFPQVQCELAVTGREWNDFVSYNKQMPDHLQLIVVRAYRDEQFISDMEAAVIQFNQEVDAMIADLPKE